MQLRSPLLLGAIALTLALLFVLVASAWSPEAPSLPHDQAQVQAALHRAPLLFIQNAGQFAPQARFQVRGGLGGGSLWLADDALWLTLLKPASPQPPSPRVGEGGEGQPPAPFEGRGAGGEGLNLRLRFLGANPQPRIEPFHRLETHVSYFLGNDPAQWRADVPVWGGVRYVGLYPGVDLELSGAGGRWGWRLLAGPGADLSAVRLSVEGAEGMAVEGDSLRLDTAIGSLALPPILAGEGAIWQPVLVEGSIAFAPSPVRLFPPFPESGGWPEDDLLYSTFLGGGGDDVGLAIAVDAGGAATVTGQTYSSNFPTTPGAFDPSFNGGDDAFVTRLNADGSGLAYSTFLGGSDSDGSLGIALDGAGAATVTGWTYSSNFPTTPGALDPSFNGGYDAFVTRLNADGSGLAYSTFLGGSGIEWSNAIALDAGGVATVTGDTESSDFPTTPGAFDTTHNGSGDAFVTRLNADGSGLLYSTFLGGNGDDWGSAIALDGAGTAYITGGTWSSNFPTTPGAFDPSFNGGYDDAFVTKLNTAGSGLVYSTFLGGSNYDFERGYAIAVDGTGMAYVTGRTGSSDFPTTPGAFDPSYNGYGDAFVTKLLPDGSGLAYSTFLGGSSATDWGDSIVVDEAGTAYITGPAGSSDFPTTPGAFDPTHNGYVDAFATRLNAAGSELVYSTFLGGGDRDEGWGIALDAGGAAYVTGYTWSSNFPTTLGAFDPTCGCDPSHFIGDAFVTRLRMVPYQLYLPLIVR